MDQKYCHACGQQLAKLDAFCSKCGASATTSDAVAKKPKSTLSKLMSGVAALFVFLVLVAVLGPLLKGKGTSSEDSGSSGSTRAIAGTAGSFLVAPDTLNAADIATLLETKMPAAMPTASWANQGYGYSERTRIFLRTDNFGKVAEVDVDQLGILSTTGALHSIPKFALSYNASAAKGADILMFASLNGPSAPLRLSFDSDPAYTEFKPNADDYVTGKMSGKVLEGMRTASQLKVAHGIGADGRPITFTYDLVELRKAIAAGLAVLGKGG